MVIPSGPATARSLRRWSLRTIGSKATTAFGADPTVTLTGLPASGPCIIVIAQLRSDWDTELVFRMTRTALFAGSATAMSTLSP